MRATERDAASWFRTSAVHLIERTETCGEIVKRHGVAVEIVETDRPGMVIYSDEFQVVAASSAVTEIMTLPIDIIDGDDWRLKV